MSKKEAFVKIYDSAGNFKDLFTNFAFTGFNASLNGGLGELNVQVPFKFDTYQESLTEGDEIRVFVADDQDQNGKRVYSGLIDLVNATASDQENVTITASGYISQMALDLHEDNQNISFRYPVRELSTTIKGILDNFNSNNPQAKVDYTADSVTNTGVSRSYKSYAQSPLDAINGVMEMAPANYFYYIDENNTFNLQPIATTPDHLFFVGVDVASITLNRSLRETRNGILFSNGLSSDDPNHALYFASDTTSTNAYGRRIEILRDSRFTNLSSIQEATQRKLDNFKEVFNTITLRIIDDGTSNTTNIKNLKPGDTCKVLNIESGNVFTDNMLVTSVNYAIDYADITILDTITYIERSIENQRNQMDLIMFQENLPESYTT